MLARLTLLLAAATVLLLSSCTVPAGTTCRSYSLGPAFGEEDNRYYPRPSHVADYSYPSSFEPVHHYAEQGHWEGSKGYGTDCNAQIPYLYR